MSKVAKLICFGGGGDSVEYGGGCRGSGYGTPESPHAAANCVIPDGTPVIDKRDAVNTPEGFAWVFKGPMCNPDLPDGDVDTCPQPSEMLASAVSGNFYGGLLALKVAHTATTAGPLDHVSIKEYVEGWRQHGARIGHYHDGQIVWD